MKKGKGKRRRGEVFCLGCWGMFDVNCIINDVITAVADTGVSDAAAAADNDDKRLDSTSSTRSRHRPSAADGGGRDVTRHVTSSRPTNVCYIGRVYTCAVND